MSTNIPSAPTEGSTGLGESLGAWVLFGLVAVTSFITYWRTPIRELYHVSSGGPGAGLSAVLGFAAKPAALMALAVLPFVVDRRPGRALTLTTLVAALLMATVFLPGAPRPLAAAGVVAAFVLTLLMARRVGLAGLRRRERGDRARIAIAAILTFCSLPWIVAQVDLSLRLPVLRSIFLTDQLRPEPGVPGLHEAVHAGNHHGLNGVILALTAILLSRALPYLRTIWLRHALAAYLAFLLAYGLGNAVQDFQREQFVKRGLMSYELPMVLDFTMTWAFGVVLLVAVTLYALVFRPLAGGRTAGVSARSSRIAREPESQLAGVGAPRAILAVELNRP